MAITSIGYAGSINTAEWGLLAPRLGRSYFVQKAADFRATTVIGADRTVRIDPGIAGGKGIVDVSDAAQTVQLTAGSRWHMVVLRRDWTAPGRTTLEVIAGTAARALPNRSVSPGTMDDQPLWLIRTASGSSEPVEYVDLRCWHGDGGVVAASAEALAYLAELGSRVTIGDTVWTRGFDAQKNEAWTTPFKEDIPAVKPWATMSLRRSDSAAVINNGFTDLRAHGATTGGSGWNTSWNGIGIAHPAPGRWWVQGSVAVDIAGPRYLELDIKAVSDGSTNLAGPVAVDTAPGGFGRATVEGLVLCPLSFAVSLVANNSGVQGSIRSSSLRASWLGPV